MERLASGENSRVEYLMTSPNDYMMDENYTNLDKDMGESQTISYITNTQPNEEVY